MEFFTLDLKSNNALITFAARQQLHRQQFCFDRHYFSLLAQKGQKHKRKKSKTGEREISEPLQTKNNLKRSKGKNKDNKVLQHIPR